MKKIMVAAAIACAAALSQAATVNWGVSNVKYGGSAATIGWSAMAFYTAVGAGSDAIISAINARTAGSLANKIEEKPLAAGFGTSQVAVHDIAVSAITDTSKNYDFYFVVFNNEVAASATEYAMVSALNKEYNGMDSKYKVSGNFTGATWNDIQAIPEPTSGLLLLVGMAGLALKRKRA